MNDKKKDIIREYFFRVFPRVEDMVIHHKDDVNLYEYYFRGKYYFTLNVLNGGEKYVLDVSSRLTKFKSLFENVLIRDVDKQDETDTNDYEIFAENNEMFCQLFSELLSVEISNVF